MHIDIQGWLHQYGYFGVFFILLFEPIGIPFPAETTLTVAGIEWTHGVFRLLPLWTSAAAGNIVGSSVAYGLGRYLGRPVILRYGRYVGITQDRLNAAGEQFNRYQGWIVLGSKFLAGIRVLVPYVAGIERMSMPRFSMYNVLGACIWSGVFIILGRTLGLEWARYHVWVDRHLYLVLVVAGVLVICFIGWRVYRRTASR
ncbi:DedA family protein [Alicyclobacillus herbarius]|uniref:DedA family protein n=1 Tax=Alicyclobacillus herbarius TaxID=122960 RepID=UPI00041AE0A9|nr:DedA family protein [Alicyclobacillus herbarius]